jgi:hypothetical protein
LVCFCSWVWSSLTLNSFKGKIGTFCFSIKWVIYLFSQSCFVSLLNTYVVFCFLCFCSFFGYILQASWIETTWWVYIHYIKNWFWCYYSFFFSKPPNWSHWLCWALSNKFLRLCILQKVHRLGQILFYSLVRMSIGNKFDSNVRDIVRLIC